MITLTDNAKNYLTATTEKHGKKYAYLGVLGGGCSGFQYEWDMTNNLEKGTLVENILILDKTAFNFTSEERVWKDIISIKVENCLLESASSGKSGLLKTVF